MGTPSHAQAYSCSPRNGYQLALYYIPCSPLQESPEENSAYEQLLSHLEEISEEGWWLAQ